MYESRDLMLQHGNGLARQVRPDRLLLLRFVCRVRITMVHSLLLYHPTPSPSAHALLDQISYPNSRSR
ncbi:hypothetical protein EVAR_82904_1 [Eumeta japonica]|uniref:Uncharacterized protein n=1 Tax=Eumeta variegata TaxID=151549 RepID=A0A4C1X202_EUMVA|nr:hypothetical protein EVAR_82904_1 [Eumeta japonica]